MRRLRRVLACAVLLAVACTGGLSDQGFARQPAPRPIVVLISIDGWRWDYLSRFAPPALSRLATRGVVSEGLIPAFPSKTFPNHYTIVTGLYPDRHGIVSNIMRDPALPGTFTLSDVDVQKDTRWWGGVPLWVSVERQGGIAATMFWPGSDREIAGDRPTYWHSFDQSVSNTARVDQVLTWLSLPEPERPNFITLYFDEVDTASHDHGPDEPEVRTAALNVDSALGRLIDAVSRARLVDRVNVIVLSDHGMAAQSHSRVIFIDDYLDLSSVDVIEWSPILGITPRVDTADAAYQGLRGRHQALQVYNNAELPARFRLAGHPRYPPIIGIADEGWTITSRSRAARAADAPAGGNHGYDPALESMHGLFVAYGPAFKSGITVPRFENVHVYELLCRTLGVKPEPNDGAPSVTAGFLK